MVAHDHYFLMFVENTRVLEFSTREKIVPLFFSVWPKMEISPRKSLKRTQEPIDEWLQSEGYFRKHAPRDPTCLFRAVSEQVYLTQHYHIRVRKECVEFMKKMKHLFTKVDITYLISFINH